MYRYSTSLAPGRILLPQVLMFKEEEDCFAMARVGKQWEEEVRVIQAAEEASVKERKLVGVDWTK